jgi:uncharacterized protein (TIGR04255 family)
MVITSLSRPTDLPDFKAPPVVEVALSVQFEPIGLSTRHLAELWTESRGRFPRWRDQVPLPPTFELFGVPPGENTWRFDFGPPPLLRAVFENAEGTELKQFQADRLIRNWIKGGNPYPRFEYICDRFLEDLKAFCDFAERHQLGRVTPNQCEVTYVNLIPPPDSGGRGLSDIVSGWSGTFSDSFLAPPEAVEIATHFLIRKLDDSPIGRLHITAAPGVDRLTGDPVTRLTLTARGQPLDANTDGVTAFLHLGREHIVRGFTSFTTRTMHEKWERCDGS